MTTPPDPIQLLFIDAIKVWSDFISLPGGCEGQTRLS